MPTLLDQDGFKFFFYSNEHKPMHVHVVRGDDFAKVELSTLNELLDLLRPKPSISNLQTVDKQL